MFGIGSSRVCGWDLQHAADGGDCGEEIDIVEFWHLHVGEIGGHIFLLRGILQPVQGFHN